MMTSTQNASVCWSPRSTLAPRASSTITWGSAGRLESADGANSDIARASNQILILISLSYRESLHAGLVRRGHAVEHIGLGHVDQALRDALQRASVAILVVHPIREEVCGLLA